MSNTSYATDLINAVQSCNARNLQQVIARLKQIAEDDVTAQKTRKDQRWVRKNYVDSPLAPLGLTALHVVCKAYSVHHGDKHLAGVFDQMASDLLDAGANPYIEIGTKYRPQSNCQGDMVLAVDKHGQTVAEVCNGIVPPSLKVLYAQWRCDELTQKRVLAVDEHAIYKEQREKGLVERRQEREARNKAGIKKARNQWAYATPPVGNNEPHPWDCQCSVR